MKRKYGSILFSTIGMMILILDSKVALQGAYEGVELCIKTVIPSLFPFFVLSILLTSSLTGLSVPLLYPLSRLCGVPRGTESILLAGFLGGYPVGAQCVVQCWRSGQLAKQDAHRMLGFCNNAGPAFIFGMTGALFDDPLIPWALWGVQILSAILVGAVLPHRSGARLKIAAASPLSISKALERAVAVMAGVCGWVVLFRMILAICERRILYTASDEARVLVTGLLELANGCHNLSRIASSAMRYVLCSLFLSFGGICVAMQTASVTAELGIGLYFPGKLLQSMLSLLLSSMLLPLFFSNSSARTAALCSSILLIVGFMSRNLLKIRKNNSRNTALQRV